MSNADQLAEIIKHSAHSFRVIREQSSLKLNDAQFTALIREFPDRFASVRFAKKDDHGNRIMPGRAGVKLIGR
ncbi:MAG: hypothetical protein P4L84_15860 [Isosphaeraceae bacterium]|nr:hypothetical protein [Isosphaeraceae bacterium]